MIATYYLDGEEAVVWWSWYPLIVLCNGSTRTTTSI